jgi:hypothetical protein
MISHLPTQGLRALLIAVLLSACSSESSSESVDLTLTETIHVAFAEMEGNVAEVAVISGADLRANPGFEAHRDAFACLAIDRSMTVLRVSSLAAPGLETALAVEIDVAAAGSEEWTSLMRFDEFAFEGLSAPLQSDAVVPSGELWLETLALSKEPRFDLAVRGEVAAAIEGLEIAIDLALFLSTDETRCAAMRAGADGQGDVVGPDAR